MHVYESMVQGKCITNKATPTRKNELPWVGLELRRVLFLLSYQGMYVYVDYCDTPIELTAHEPEPEHSKTF